MKCSAVVRDGSWVGVNKNPSTDPMKASKKGLLELHYTKEKGYFTTAYTSWEDAVVNATYNYKNRVMNQVYSNGQIMNTSSLLDIKERTEK
jgi:nicotinic acid phosphoribosyltransferase